MAGFINAAQNAVTDPGSVAGQVSQDLVKGAIQEALYPYSDSWNNNLCGCWDKCGITCQTWWCYHCSVGNVINKLETGQGVHSCKNCMLMALADYATNGAGSMCLAAALRREMKQRYRHNDENSCTSLMTAFCCTPCVMCQVQREMVSRFESAGGICNTGIDLDMAPDAKKIGSAALRHGFGKTRQPAPMRSGVCGCNLAECCDGYFCEPCVLGYMSTRLDNPNGVPETLSCINACGACCCTPVWRCMVRREIIQRYNISNEDYLTTCVYTTFCPFCSTLQTRREMDKDGEFPGGCCVNLLGGKEYRKQ